MSWHFSLALEEAYSAAYSWDGKPCVPWKLILTAPASLCSGKMKATFHRFPFGTMYVPSEDESGAALLTWFRVASRARTSALVVKELVSQASVVDCGLSFPGLLTKYDRYTHSWKIPIYLSIVASPLFSGTWPKWGMMRNGAVFLRETWVSRILGKDFGYLLSTPTAVMPLSLTSPNVWRARSGSLRKTANTGVTGSANWCQEMAAYGTVPTPEFCESIMGWVPGWSNSSILATGKFRQWLRRHGQS